MRVYCRPLVQTDPVRPPEALPVAGGWGWFTHGELIERGGARRIVPAAACPEPLLRAITAPRPPLLGLKLEQPHIMGILNLTPDSFSDGGAFLQPEKARKRVREMARAGADLIDIGGESTRPGAAPVAPAEEIARVLPVIEAVAGSAPPISIDTRKGAVAQAALKAGARMINDVSGLGFDPQMAEIAARSGAPVCIMHSRGTPETMQDDPQYEDVLLDVYDALEARVAQAEAAGIARARIVVDPGIGFGKTQAHNLALLRGLALFHGLGCALLLGVSRKGFIGRIGQAPVAAERMPGSLAVALAGLAKGVQITRVHDVRETRQGFALWQAATGLRQAGT